MNDLEALRATAHPLRLRLLSLVTGSAMSAAEAARVLGERQANISYHLRLLARAGLVEVVETTTVRGGLAKRYRHTSSSIPPPATGSTPAEALDARGPRAPLVNAMIEELRRRITMQVPGAQTFVDAEVWVDESTWHRVVDLVGEAAALLHGNAQDAAADGTMPVSMTAALFRLGSE